MIDRAVAAARLHFRSLFPAMLVLQAPALAMARLASDQGPALLAAASDPAAAAARAPAALATFSLLLLLLFLLQAVATAVTAAVLAPSLAPHRPGDGAGLPPGWGRRLARAAATGLLQQLLLVAALALGMTPGLLLLASARSSATAVVGAVAVALGGPVLFLVTLLRTILAPVAVGVEGLGPWSAVRRSVRLMAPRPGRPAAERPSLRASLLLLTAFVLTLAVNGLAGLPRAVAGGLAGGGPLPFLPGALPLPLEVGLSLFELVTGAALQPFSLAAVVVFYFERRARTEGLDLEAWAARLESQPPGTFPPVARRLRMARQSRRSPMATAARKTARAAPAHRSASLVPRSSVSRSHHPASQRRSSSTRQRLDWNSGPASTSASAARSAGLAIGPTALIARPPRRGPWRGWPPVAATPAARPRPPGRAPRSGPAARSRRPPPRPGRTAAAPRR
jgi:hypothetical protein